MNATVVNNTARYGAGLLSGGGSELRCVGCVISGNRADHYGGGVLAGGGVNRPSFINSVITANVALEEVRTVFRALAARVHPQRASTCVLNALSASCRAVVSTCQPSAT